MLSQERIEGLKKQGFNTDNKELLWIELYDSIMSQLWDLKELSYSRGMTGLNGRITDDIRALLREWKSEQDSIK